MKWLIRNYTTNKSLTERFDGKLTRSTKELQAESIAYVVSSHLGFDTSQESFPYLASWSKEKDGLANLNSTIGNRARRSQKLNGTD
ncbi:putative conjugative transposon membrane protein [Streptococcus dysgalactiae subsp. equisimilis]|uniref:Conjugative transposon membrane protein n=1 Tax=Streptococcus dysgalactiae subsp. equisimilis TaxID=119602 RepID=A0AAE9U3Y2_STREQ|nr:putative conjugative transposon membrane protein [Streptococcus dysgalactiae subsp. equisimilis]